VRDKKISVSEVRDKMKPTREQILAEPAGMQMDAWVAEFVMGWIPVYIGDNITAHELSDGSVITGYFRPSTNIASALEVVEKLAKPPWAWGIDSINIGDEHRWDVVYWGDESHDDFVRYELPEPETCLPLAICKVALLAVCAVGKEYAWSWR